MCIAGCIAVGVMSCVLPDISQEVSRNKDLADVFTLMPT